MNDKKHNQKDFSHYRDETEDLTIAELYERYNGKDTNTADVTAVLEDNEHLLAAEQQPYSPDVDLKIGKPKQKQPPRPLAKADNSPTPKKSSPPPKQPKSKQELIKEKKRRLDKQRQSRRTFAHIFASVLLVVFIVSVSSLLAYNIVRGALDYLGITSNEFEVNVEIPEGATNEQIVSILHENGIVDFPEFFQIYIDNKESQIFNHGLITFNSSMMYSHIIDAMQDDTRTLETVSVRIREGMSAREIGFLLEENMVCTAKSFEQYYLNMMNAYSFEKRLQQNPEKCFQLEGYLYPDTYEFFINPDIGQNEEKELKNAKEAAKTMYNNFNQKITKSMYKTIHEMGFTLDEFITLASMVQMEAGIKEDMELVASVFLNRLRNSEAFPRLESDVTIKYGNETIAPYMGETGELRRLEQMIKNYDTYQSDGLPPGPVCNPGMDAMLAVLNAPESSYYYFCANLDTQETLFAETLAQHEQNLITAGLVTAN